MTSPTAAVSACWKAASSTLPASRWWLASMRASGRGRLPAWLVRMRSLLRLMSTPLELGGLALLGEGARSFLEILGEIETLRRGLEHDLAAQLVHVPATHAHGRAHAERRVLDHLVRQPARHVEIFALGRHAIDQVGLI